MKLFIFIVSIAILLMFSGCRTSITPEQKVYIKQHSVVYTQVPIWITKKNIAYGTNYNNGILIPINSPITVIAVNNKKIKFKYQNSIYIYYIMTKHTKIRTEDMLDRLFASNQVSLFKYAPNIQANIQKGKIINGMTKEEVLLARGYPPYHKTRSIQENTWKYWNTSRVTKSITFMDDRVSYGVGLQAPIKTVTANKSTYQYRTKQQPRQVYQNQHTDNQNLRRIYQTQVKPNYTFKMAEKINYNSFALVIGINKYSQNTPVEYADLSALAFEDLAISTFGVPKENVITILNEKATSGNIKAKIELIKELSESDGNIYLFFAGHGVPGKNGDTYMLPTDMTADAIHLEVNLKLDNIYKKLAKSNAKNVFVFMDSCFSGKDDQGGLLYKGIAPVLRTKKLTISQEKLTVFTAGKSTDFANDYQEKQQRLFTYYLIENLSEGQRDLSDVYQNIRLKVKRTSLMKGIGYKQIPQIYGKQEKKLY